MTAARHISGLLDDACRRLRAVSDAPRLEAEVLLARAIDLPRSFLFAHPDDELDDAAIERLEASLLRRERGEPMAYITGEREFWSMTLMVTPATLIPRPETELLVDVARERAAELGREDLRVADLGTGSGCLAVTLALELPGAEVHAADLAPSAVQQARRNVERLGARVEVHLGDGLEALAPHAPFDLFVSNPPYVAQETRASLQPEVRDYEPELALFAPDGDPDHWVRRLVEALPDLVAPGGSLLVELGADQGPRALALAERAGHAAELREDLARIPRVLAVRRDG